MEIKKELLRSTPEEQGVSSSSIINFIDAAAENNIELHGLMILRHGYVVAEGWWKPYRSDYPHELFSLSKSFTSTAIGFAVDEGLLSVDDKVISFFSDDIQDQTSEKLEKLTVYHLLTMSTGHDENSTAVNIWTSEDKSWVKTFLSSLIKYEPGTYFQYNSGATYMLSAIIQKLSGTTLFNYLEKRLFSPLDFRSTSWRSCPLGINIGFMGLSIKTEDIAKFGQLYLDEGVWNNRRILSKKWIKQATKFHIDNSRNNENIDWQLGYGYQFWLCQHGGYRADGAGGQLCIVMPKQNAVIAVTSGMNDIQKELNLIWKHLLPAMGNKSLSVNSALTFDLNQKMSNLGFLPLQGNYVSAFTNKYSVRKYKIENNDENINFLQINFLKDSCIYEELFNNTQSNVIQSGYNKWIEDGKLVNQYGFILKTAGSAVWKDDNTLELLLLYCEYPGKVKIVINFRRDKIYIEKTNNCYGAENIVKLIGTAV
ncbi:MAG: serine hydrolase [bacterium]|nr:serine hydrolase [bacterium]